MCSTSDIVSDQDQGHSLTSSYPATPALEITVFVHISAIG